MSNVHALPSTRHPLTDSDDLAFEIVLGYFSREAICLKFGIDDDTLATLEDDPGFRVKLLDQSRKIDERGDGFRLQARQHIEDSLASLKAMANDKDAAKGVRMKAIELLAKYAGYDGESGAAAGITLQIKTNLDVGGSALSGNSYVITAQPPKASGEGDDPSDLL